MTPLDSVVAEYNAQKSSSDSVVTTNTMTTSDASDMFRYTDRMLQSTGYVQSESAHFLSAEDNEEHERYLTATLTLLETGYNPPMGTVSF